MVFNWKKTFIALFDIAIAVYLLLAVSAFNTPAEKATVCTEVKIDINNEAVGGFVNQEYSVKEPPLSPRQEYGRDQLAGNRRDPPEKPVCGKSRVL